MIQAGLLSYPDNWTVNSFSPPVEDVQAAYVRGEVSDHALDNEIEWALSRPEPPVPVYIMEDEALLTPESVPSETLELAEDESNTVEVDIMETEIQFFDAPPQRVPSYVEITCHLDDVEMVLQSLADSEHWP